MVGGVVYQATGSVLLVARWARNREELFSYLPAWSHWADIPIGHREWLVLGDLRNSERVVGTVASGGMFAVAAGMIVALGYALLATRRHASRNRSSKERPSARYEPAGEQDAGRLALGHAAFTSAPGETDLERGAVTAAGRHSS